MGALARSCTRAAAALVGLAALVSACGKLVGIQDTTTVAEAGVVVDASRDDAAGGDDDGSVDPLDGEVAPSDAGPCPADARAAPVRSAFVETSSGVHCGVAEAIEAADDQALGLDFDETTTTNAHFDGKFVTGCVGAQLQGTFPTVVVRARSVEKACGNDCTGTGCGTGMWFGLFVRTDAGPKWIATPTLTTSFADQTVRLPAAVATDPLVIVCRSSSAGDRNDVLVDFVGGCR